MCNFEAENLMSAKRWHAVCLLEVGAILQCYQAPASCVRPELLLWHGPHLEECTVPCFRDLVIP